MQRTFFFFLGGGGGGGYSITLVLIVTLVYIKFVSSTKLNITVCSIQMYTPCFETFDWPWTETDQMDLGGVALQGGKDSLITLFTRK